MNPVSIWQLRPVHLLAFAEAPLFWLARLFAWLHHQSVNVRAGFGETGIERHWREHDQFDAAFDAEWESF